MTRAERACVSGGFQATCIREDYNGKFGLARAQSDRDMISSWIVMT
ncbi:hypothetical protein BamMEX5DRAFT_1948 [Burkholderia ambifaria MEX-5]|uniref:Uncharacterized protein n=1 Tax=Burkholderia ambifaria MEX-5 TaxID=396597 RepID=B1T2D2_9BURK|nr:hypothetical protein BamMEX5DRAFT_1948 [Burkholderia ambifaria MEX-5]